MRVTFVAIFLLLVVIPPYDFQVLAVLRLEVVLSQS
jgi:hypothetical protein